MKHFILIVLVLVGFTANSQTNPAHKSASVFAQGIGIKSTCGVPTRLPGNDSSSAWKYKDTCSPYYEYCWNVKLKKFDTTAGALAAVVRPNSFSKGLTKSDTIVTNDLLTGITGNDTITGSTSKDGRSMVHLLLQFHQH